MIKETTENLYPFIASQLSKSKEYWGCNKRTRFYDTGMPMYTCLIICKGPRHHLTVSYNRHTEEFMICLRKPQGTVNEVTVRKYA